jgi:hypothetical protein
MLQRQEPNYFSIVIIGKSQRKIWQWDIWHQFVPVLAPLMSSSDAHVSVRSIQRIIGQKNDVRFGRLGWNENDHQKWAHGSPLNQVESAKWTFCATEIWTPSWTVYEREGVPPYVFLRIENPFVVGQPQPGQFNQWIQLALLERVYRGKSADVQHAIRAITQLIEGILTVIHVQPWSLNYDSIQACLANHVSYLGVEKDVVPDLARMNSQLTKFNPKMGAWMVYVPDIPLPQG